MLKQHNIAKDRLLNAFDKVGHPMSEPTLNKRLKDQQWSYAHAQLFKQLNLWIEPELNQFSKSLMLYIYGVEK